MGVLVKLDFNYRSKLWSQQEAAVAFKPLMPHIDICFCGELDAVHLLEYGFVIYKCRRIKHFLFTSGPSR